MESKIEATRRLQREGRWTEATEARDQEKHRLRDQGMTRREANEASWRWMIEQFPPLSAEEVAWGEAAEYLAMAELPIDHPAVNIPGKPRFEHVWFVLCYLAARDAQIQRGQTAGAKRVERILCSEVTDPQLAILGTFALLRPEAFLKGAERLFRLVVEALTEDPSADQRLADEVAAFREEIPGMIQRLDSEAAQACGDVYVETVQDGEDEANEGVRLASAAPEGQLEPTASHARA